MAIAHVQTVTGTGALVINSVVSGNALICMQSFFRNPSTQAVSATPTDSAGTFTGGIAGVPAYLWNSTFDTGVGMFYQANAASGTHTVTPGVENTTQNSVSEFSGMATSSLLDVSATAKTADLAHTSHGTGTTAATAQNDELVCICHTNAAFNGSTDISYTDPVTGFTTSHKASNNASSVAAFHAYKIISATGTQTATFNWTYSEDYESSHAAIGTFKAAAGAAKKKMLPGLLAQRLMLGH